MKQMTQNNGSTRRGSSKSAHTLLRAVFIFSLLVSTLIHLSLAWKDSQTIDEAAHISAGVSYIETGDFRLNPEHPTLFKLLSGVFVSALDTKPIRQTDGWDKADQWKVGKDFLYNSRSDDQIILFVGRLPMIAISLCLVLATYYLGLMLASKKIGYIAGSLLALDPTLLGHGHLVTNDTLLALGLVLFTVASIRYVKKSDKNNLVILSLAMLVCLLAKFSGLAVVSAFIALVYWQNKGKFLTTIKCCLLGFGIVFAGIWTTYFFQVGSIAGDVHGEQSIDVKVPTVLENLPIPAYSYLRGMATLFYHNSEGHESYLLGQNYSSSILYIPIAIITKLPSYILVTFIFSVLYVFLRRRTISLKDHMVIGWLIIPTLLFISLAMTSSIRIGIRHVLPVWPLLYLLFAYIVVHFIKPKNVRYIPLVILLPLTSLLFISHPLSFNNLLGKLVTKQIDAPVLIDSNLDWSQDIYRLRDYIRNNNINSFGEVLFTNIPLNKVIDGVRSCELDPLTAQCVDREAVPCIVAISDTAKWKHQTDYRWLSETHSELTRIGGSITIYNCKNPAT